MNERVNKSDEEADSSCPWWKTFPRLYNEVNGKSYLYRDSFIPSIGFYLTVRVNANRVCVCYFFPFFLFLLLSKLRVHFGARVEFLSHFISRSNMIFHTFAATTNQHDSPYTRIGGYTNRYSKSTIEKLLNASIFPNIGRVRAESKHWLEHWSICRVAREWWIFNPRSVADRPIESNRFVSKDRQQLLLSRYPRASIARMER